MKDEAASRQSSTRQVRESDAGRDLEHALFTHVRIQSPPLPIPRKNIITQQITRGYETLQAIYYKRYLDTRERARQETNWVMFFSFVFSFFLGDLCVVL